MPGFYRLPEIYTPWWYLLLGRHGNCVSSILYQISWFILSVSFTFRTRLIQTWSSTLEIHKCTAVLIRIVMLQRSELYTDAIRLRAYGSDTYLMTLQNWSTSVNLSVSFTKGNGTVSCLNIFGCVDLAHVWRHPLRQCSVAQRFGRGYCACVEVKAVTAFVVGVLLSGVASSLLSNWAAHISVFRLVAFLQVTLKIIFVVVVWQEESGKRSSCLQDGGSQRRSDYSLEGLAPRLRSDKVDLR